MISISPEVESALARRGAVTALESTVIAHGLPAPHNLETARECELAVRRAGAVPATIGIAGGLAKVGLIESELIGIATRGDVAKVNPANLSSVIAGGGWGATTVAASLYLAGMAGIMVFATGGIGGVHRAAADSFDISADLNALAHGRLVTVCAGAKAILDLPKTLEVLETLGVPVIGYQTDEMPAFYSRSSGLKLDLVAQSADRIAEIAKIHWGLGFQTGILVVAPVPAPDELPADEIAEIIEESLVAATAKGITGKSVTPFLLSHIASRTEGRALKANISLLKNNAEIAGRIAREMTYED